MEIDPPKKKKKYVPVNKATVAKEPSNQIRQKQALTTTQGQGKALDHCRFDYSFEDIVNHLLARLLPNSNFTIKLSEKLIFGQEKALDKFIIKLDENIKYTAGFILQLKVNVTKEDIDYSMQENFRGKTFNYKLIEMSVKDFFVGTKYQREYDAFLAQFKDEQKIRLYVRLTKEYKMQFLQKVQDEASIVEKEEEEPPTRRGNRTTFKNQIDSIEIDSDVFDLNDMYRFFSKSNKLDRSDLSVTKNKSKYDEIVSYKISLLSYETDKERKIQGFTYYFRHQNFVLLPLKQCKHKDEIIQQYGNIKEPHIQTRVLKGYKSSKWEDKSLLYKIRAGSITNRRTNYTNEYFEAIHLKGLLPIVKSYIKKLEDSINQVPLDDIQQELFVEFDDKIKDYIRNEKDAQQFVEKFIKEYMLQFQDICSLQKVKFPLRGVKLNLRIKNNEEEQFEHIRQNIEKVMPKYIAEQRISVDFSIDQEFLRKLKQEGVLVVDLKEKEFVYLTSTQDLERCVQVVQRAMQEFQSVGEQTLEVVGLTKKQKYWEEIHKIKKESEEYAQILIAQPLTSDKVHYIITFYGPRKKNDKFVQEVRRSIDKMESQLGQYSEFIDQKVSKLIVQDHQIQQEIEQQCRVSLIVSNCVIEAKLEVCSKKKSQILIMKATNLQKVSLGAYIFFEDKTLVQELKQRYLDKFKINVKRYKQDKWLVEHENTRNYHFLYKYNSTIEDILNEAVTRGNSDETILLSLMMPKTSKKQWLNKIFDSLSHDKQLSQMAFKIYIIETDSTEQIDKIVNIPEYSPFTADNEEIFVEWFCQKKPYSKTANAKINDAIANSLTTLILDKDDIGHNANTHICDLNKRVITYQAGGTYQQIPFFFQNSSITFTHQGRKLTFPQSEYNKVMYHRTISLQNRFFLNMPFYLVDLVKNVQINLFTNFERKLEKKETKVTHEQGFKGVIKAFYNQKMTQLIYSFKEIDSKQLRAAAGKMKQYINNHWNKEVLPIKDISEVMFKDLLKERITARAQEYSLQFQFDPLLKSITVESFQMKDIQKFKHIMETEIQYMINVSKKSSLLKGPDIKYPPFWEAQSKQIQTFEVDRNTPEFDEVNKLFATRPVHSITRIQNKIIYRRYMDELEHLSHMNGRQPKQMKLFHGTMKTSPEVIWSDQEDGFNINYSSENNLLGRGIYFAQRAEYSVGYASKQGTINNKTIYGMFLCTVIVGDSQLMQLSHGNRNVIDTSFKPNSMRFQSSKGIHSISDLYVVYKNRRAYPLYFIRFTQ